MWTKTKQVTLNKVSLRNMCWYTFTWWFYYPARAERLQEDRIAVEHNPVHTYRLTGHFTHSLISKSHVNYWVSTKHHRIRITVNSPKLYDSTSSSFYNQLICIPLHISMSLIFQWFCGTYLKFNHFSICLKYLHLEFPWYLHAKTEWITTFCYHCENRQRHPHILHCGENKTLLIKINGNQIYVHSAI